MAGIQPARYKIVAGTFRRAAGENRGLKLGKTHLAHPPPDDRDDFGSELNSSMQAMSTQIEESVLEPSTLAQEWLFRHGKRQRIRLRVHGQVSDYQFNLPGRHAQIDVGGGSPDDLTGHRDHRFAPQSTRLPTATPHWGKTPAA